VQYWSSARAQSTTTEILAKRENFIGYERLGDFFAAEFLCEVCETLCCLRPIRCTSSILLLKGDDNQALA
jgi:hypothetical protein